MCAHQTHQETSRREKQRFGSHLEPSLTGVSETCAGEPKGTSRGDRAFNRSMESQGGRPFDKPDRRVGARAWKGRLYARFTRSRFPIIGVAELITNAKAAARPRSSLTPKFVECRSRLSGPPVDRFDVDVSARDALQKPFRAASG
jgi:hypothetical protein